MVHKRINFSYSLKSIFIIAWFSGLFSGLIIASELPIQQYILIRYALTCSTSLLITLTGISAFFAAAFLLSRTVPFAVIILAFARAYSFSYVFCCIGMVYRTASWLAWPLYLFPDTICVALFFLYCLKHSIYSDKNWLPCVRYATLSMAIALIDKVLLFPFVSGIHTC